MFIIFRGIQHYIFHLSLCKTLVLVFLIRRNDQRVFLHRCCFKKTFLLKKKLPREAAFTRTSSTWVTIQVKLWRIRVPTRGSSLRQFSNL